MVELARRAGVEARVADVQDLPFDDDEFNCAAANWMLYHVPDLDHALAELARVLRPRGRLVAVTNGDDHLPEVWQLVAAEQARRALGPYVVRAVEAELRSESLAPATFDQLDPDGVRLAKTASRSTLGFMNEMAVHLRYQIAGAGGLSRCDINTLNHHLRRTLHNRGGYVYPIELAAQRLDARA